MHKRLHTHPTHHKCRFRLIRSFGKFFTETKTAAGTLCCDDRNPVESHYCMYISNAPIVSFTSQISVGFNLMELAHKTLKIFVLYEINIHNVLVYSGIRAVHVRALQPTFQLAAQPVQPPRDSRQSLQLSPVWQGGHQQAEHYVAHVHGARPDQ